jgi:hypothetical protein
VWVNHSYDYQHRQGKHTVSPEEIKLCARAWTVRLQQRLGW